MNRKLKVGDVFINVNFPGQIFTVSNESETVDDYVWVEDQYKNAYFVPDVNEGRVVANPVAKKIKNTKTNRLGFAPKPKGKSNRLPLYGVSTKGGLTFKGFANKVMERGGVVVGNTPLHALSNYEDRHGKKLSTKNAVIWKLTPYTLQVDGKNNKYRIGKEIK